MNKMKIVGKLSEEMQCLIGYYDEAHIVMSDGLRGHVFKRHKECLKYISQVSLIIEAPDYAGRYKNGDEYDFELVKEIDNYVYVGIRFSSTENYFYVSTIHLITESKINSMIRSGRLIRLDN